MMISKLLGITVLGVYSLYLGVTAQSMSMTKYICVSISKSSYNQCVTRYVILLLLW